MNTQSQSNPQAAAVSKKALWTGYIMSALPVLVLLMGAVTKFVKPAFVVDGFAHFGLPQHLIVGIGILELGCTIIYLIPRTAVLGAILLTGYLGGAILTHLRIGELVIAQAIFGVLIWGGLYMRDLRVRALIPLRQVSS